MSDATYQIIRSYVINIAAIAIIYYSNPVEWFAWAVLWLLAFIAAYVSIQWGTTNDKK